MRLGIVLAAAVLGTAATAFAKDTPQSVADEAKLLGRSGEHLKAAERYGDAVALAHAANDLQGEKAVADSLEEWFDKLPKAAAKPDAGKGATSAAARDPTARGALLAAVMRKLDPNRCGGFVSAPCLAREVLLLATETGDMSSVADAAKVAAVHAGKATSGRAAAVVAKYAEGMKAVADGKFDSAAPLLDAMASDAAKGGWLDLAAHAGTEAAASWIRSDHADKAALSITTVAAAFGADAGVMKADVWSAYATKRLAGAPSAVLKPFDDLIARSKDLGSPAGAGGSAKSKSASDISKLLPTIAKGKPFVSIARTRSGFEVHWTTSSEKPTKAFDDIVRYLDNGGVTVALHDRSVALRSVELESGNGRPGDGYSPCFVRAFYLLAEGETWGVTKDGVVSIAH